MGHGRCGGIRAAVGDAGPLSHTDFIGSWMRAIKDVARAVPHSHDSALHERHIERASIEHSLANLRTFGDSMKEIAKSFLARHLVYIMGIASCLTKAISRVS